MSTTLEILTSKNLIGRKGPKKSALTSLSLLKIIDIAENIEETVKNSHRYIHTPVFSHSVSSDECSGINCRLERINRLARFALIYSDKLYLPSFFSRYVGSSEHFLDQRNNLDYMREQLYNDITIIHEIRDLLQSDEICFFSPLLNVCFSCQAKEYLGEKIGARFDKNYKQLQNEYLKRMSVQCEKEIDDFTLIVDCPDPYLNHGYTISLNKVPRILINKMKNTDKANLSRSLIKKLELHMDAAHSVASNAIYGLATSACLKTSFLTEQDIHISFLNSLHSNIDISKKNAIALKHLAAIVPFVNDVALKDLAKLRNRESESFLVFRQALTQAIEIFVATKGDFTEKDAISIHGDIIEPTLASLDRKVKLAKRDLVIKPIRSILSIVGIISFGLFTGLLPENISGIAKVLGLLKFGSDTFKDILEAGDKEKAIENESFYFLWKVKEKARRKVYR